jgi:hypothetical protein
VRYIRRGPHREALFSLGGGSFSSHATDETENGLPSEEETLARSFPISQFLASNDEAGVKKAAAKLGKK